MFPVLSAVGLTPMPLLAVGRDPVLDPWIAGAVGALERDRHHGVYSKINLRPSLKHSISSHYPLACFHQVRKSLAHFFWI